VTPDDLVDLFTLIERIGAMAKKKYEPVEGQIWLFFNDKPERLKNECEVDGVVYVHVASLAPNDSRSVYCELWRDKEDLTLAEQHASKLKEACYK